MKNIGDSIFYFPAESLINIDSRWGLLCVIGTWTGLLQGS